MLDIAATSEFALVREGFNRNDLQAISSIALSNNIQLIARRDRGIKSPGRPQGQDNRRLARDNVRIFPRHIPCLHGILNSEVQMVNIRPSDAASGILSKNIDAAMLWDPYAYKLKTALGKKAIVWEGQGGQDYYVLLISTRSFTDAHAAAVEKLLRALVEAERFTETDPAESKRIIQRRFRYNDAYMAWTWARSSPKVCLTQDLLIHMEDEGRWLKKRGWVDYPGIPNYYALMYLDGLEKVNPDAVSIIHYVSLGPRGVPVLTHRPMPVGVSRERTMSIKTRLKISASVLIVLAMTMIATLVLMAREIEEATEEGLIADRIVKGAGELNVLARAFVSRQQEESTEAQWWDRHNSLALLIGKASLRGEKQKLLLDRLTNTNAGLEAHLQSYPHISLAGQPCFRTKKGALYRIGGKAGSPAPGKNPGDGL